jgi:hypothetical protein
MTKYAVVSTDGTNLAIGAGIYTGTSFSDFASGYADAHPNQLPIDIGTSLFPAGQGWMQSTDTNGRVTWAPPGNQPYTMAQVRAGLLASIIAKTQQLLNNGTITYNSHPFPTDAGSRAEFGVLAALVGTSSTAASALLPYAITSLDGTEMSLATTDEAMAFAVPLAALAKTYDAAEDVQVAAVTAMTTINQLVSYIDPR